MRRPFVVCPGCGAHLDPGERCEDCYGPIEIVRERRIETWASDRAPTSRTPSA